MKPTSDRKRQANRRNAQKSTGPRTPEGKARSRANAIKHGLLAETVLINGRDPIENPDDLNDLLNALIDHFSPRDPHQQLLVERLAICYWRLRRAYRHEAQSIMQRRADDRSEHAKTSRQSEGQPEPFLAALPADAEFSKLIRYESLIDRELQRTLQQLHRAQRPEPFTPITPPPPDGTPASAGPHGSLADLLADLACLDGETNSRPAGEPSEPGAPATGPSEPQAPATGRVPRPSRSEGWGTDRTARHAQMTKRSQSQAAQDRRHRSDPPDPSSGAAGEPSEPGAQATGPTSEPRAHATAPAPEPRRTLKRRDEPRLKPH